MKVYGYCRISTMKQNIKRQISNIKAQYPEAVIVTEEYTGTKMDERPNWTKLYKQLKDGDTVVFDQVSRMSRDAEEGFKVYQELYERGCELIFLKEPHINTASYREALKGSLKVDVKSGDKDTDDLISGIMTAVNKFMMAKVKGDIKKAFDQAEKEVEDLHQRTREGLREVKRRNDELIFKYGSEEEARKDPDWRQRGQLKGAKLTTKKSIAAKEIIQKHSKDFNGTLSDAEVMKLCGIARGTFYKYKRELKAE